MNDIAAIAAIEAAANQSRLILGSNISAVINAIKKAVKPNQVKAFAKSMYKGDAEKFGLDLYNFILNEIKYKKDTYGTEEIRTPARTFADRFTGVDCEDYTIFICSCFIACNIKCHAEIVSFGSGWAHIYPVLDLPNGSIPIDPTPYPDGSNIPFGEKAKEIEKIMKIQMLEGLQGLNTTNCEAHSIPEYKKAIAALHAEGIQSPQLGKEFRKAHYLDLLKPIQGTKEYNFLTAAMTHAIDDVPADLSEFKLKEGWNQEMLAGLEALMTDKLPKEVEYQIIESMNEEELEGLAGFSDIGKNKAQRKEDRQNRRQEKKNKPKVKLKDKIKKAANSATNFIKKNVNSAIKDVKKGVNKGIKLFKKLNPAFVLVRTGIRLAIVLNMFRWGSKFKLARLSASEATAKGLDAGEHAKLVKAYEKAKNFFVNDLQGKPSAFDNAVIKASTKRYDKKKGFSGLGVAPAIAAGAPIAAGTPFFPKLMEILKEIDFKKLIANFKGNKEDIGGDTNDDGEAFGDEDIPPGTDAKLGPDEANTFNDSDGDGKPDSGMPKWLLPAAAAGVAIVLLMK